MWLHAPCGYLFAHPCTSHLSAPRHERGLPFRASLTLVHAHMEMPACSAWIASAASKSVAWRESAFCLHGELVADGVSTLTAGDDRSRLGESAFSLLYSSIGPSLLVRTSPLACTETAACDGEALTLGVGPAVAVVDVAMATVAAMAKGGWRTGRTRVAVTGPGGMPLHAAVQMPSVGAAQPAAATAAAAASTAAAAASIA